MKRYGNTVVFDFHELAWSLRTCDRPIYALVKDDEYKLVQIGRTEKRRMRYELPPGAVGVAVPYYSNRGYCDLWYYTLDGKLQVCREREDYRGAKGDALVALKLLGWVEE